VLATNEEVYEVQDVRALIKKENTKLKKNVNDLINKNTASTCYNNINNQLDATMRVY